ncbi:MAG: N-acetylmuramoyl-L-alanine amidase [Vicinamibacterales bacterium]
MRKQAHRPIHVLPRAAAAVLVSFLWASWPAGARAQSPAGALYQQAQTAEQAARADTPPSLDAVRKVAKIYEGIVLRYPTSGYADNALWQAAGLMTTAFQQSSAATDRQQVERYLKWLKQEYPSSPFVKQVDGVLAALPAAPATGGTPAAPAADAAPTPASASPSSSPASAPAANGPAAVVKNITESALPHGERITIELSKEVTYSGDRVENPDRVFFDFTNATAPLSLADHVSLSGNLVKALRVGRHANNVTRVVLELAGNPRYSTFSLYDPFRLVVDVESAEAAPPAASSPPAASAAAVEKAAATPPPARTTPAPAAPAPHPDAGGSPAPPSSNRSGDYSLSRQLGLTVSRIVIDAGHGGHDPGAQANGIDESELTLDVAQRLQKLLEAQPGFAVVLTRSTDEYVALEERTAIANREGADLFLSIHANASKEPTAHGIETYFLNFATNPTAESVAARENASSSQPMGTLPEILKAIAMNNKLAESRELAASVQTALVRKLSAQNKATRDLGVRQAPFVVLIGAQMPSVLAEISFLTNRTEAALLKQSSYRQRIAQALCDGILKYQASLKKVTNVAAKEGGR